MRSAIKNYLLDEIKLQATHQDFGFRLNTVTVLQKAGIPPQSLRGNAIIWQQFRPIYFPIVFEKPTSYYDVILIRSTETNVTSAQIRRDGKLVSGSLKTGHSSLKKEIVFHWYYNNLVSGLYELYLKDQNDNNYSFYLAHN